MLPSATGVTQKIARFRSPRERKSISSRDVIFAYWGRASDASRTPAEIKMLLAVLPAPFLNS